MATVNGSNFYSDVNSALSIALTDHNGLAMLAKCVGVPPTTAGIFQHGCLINQTDSGTGVAALYQNVGSAAVPSWVIIDSSAPPLPALPPANLFVGNNLGVATPTLISGDVSINDTGFTSLNAGVVSSANLSADLIQTIQVNLSALDIVSMNSTPIEVIPTPGAVSAIQFISAILIYDFDIAAYTDGGNVTINYTGGAAVSDIVSAANSFASATDEITGFSALVVAGGAPILANTGLSITNDTTDFVNPGTAAGVGRLIINYRVIQTGL